MFSYYTGFAYIDVAHLSAEYHTIGIDGKEWLIKNRQKTNISERVPVLPRLKGYSKNMRIIAIV
jgi:hypothetical protein